jgi:PAS domain S-box-containing protein
MFINSKPYQYYTFIVILCLFIFNIFQIKAQDSQKAIHKEAQLEKETSDRVKFHILTELCWLYRNNNPRQGLQKGKQALKIAEKNPDLDLSVLYTYIGVVYRNVGNYTLSLDYFTKANHEAEKRNNQKQLGYSYQSIADILNRQGYNQKAEENIKQALVIFKKIEDQEGISYTYHTWGKIAESLKKYEQALHYHYQALEIRKNIGKNLPIASTQTQIGILYKLLKKLDRSIEYLEDAKKTFEKEQASSGIVNTLNHLSEIYFLKNNNQQSTEYAQKALQLALTLHDPDLIYKTYESLSKIYEKEKEFKKSLQAQKLSIIYKDSLFNKEKQWQGITMQDKFEDDKNKIEIDLLTSQNARQTLWFYVLLALAVFLIVIFSIIFYNLKQKRNLTKKIQEQSKSLQQKNKDIATTNEKLQDAQQKWEDNVKILTEANKKLEELSSFQKAVWDNLDMIIMTVDKKGIITSFNPTAEKMLGYVAEELVNKQTASIFLDNKEIQNNQSDNDDEWTYFTKSKSPLSVSVNVNLLKNENEEILGHLIVAQDISKKKKIENEIKKIGEKLEHLQSMAKMGIWEINFPAQKVTWSSQMFELYGLNKDLPPPTVEEYLKKYTHPEDLSLLIKTVENTRNQEFTEANIRSLNAEGKEVKFTFRAKALLSGSGKWIGAIGIAILHNEQ